MPFPVVVEARGVHSSDRLSENAQNPGNVTVSDSTRVGTRSSAGSLETVLRAHIVLYYAFFVSTD